ncbi:MAG: uracil phosphoribosyltransferase [Candidatus Gastranaerophilales bacterium]|nr:uracil phosphoribosyltransferase [Candidatus Gastranaerophilales bacterium]
METSLKKPENISVCEHPLALHNLTIMRDKNTSAELFRNATRRLAEVLFFSSTDNLPTVKTQIETPIALTESQIIDPEAEIIIAPILRAGLLFGDVASTLLPDARVHHLGLYRDEVTLKPVTYYNNLPKNFKNPNKTYVYILDPMLATGGSAIASIQMLEKYDIPHENIRFICLLSAPEGIKTFHAAYPDIKVITAWIDERLNQNGYIVPGLGDAGDRTFNTIY